MKSSRYPGLPPLNTLLAFEAAARHESFSHASQDLFVSASAIAHQIKLLEAALGVELFIRHSRGVELNTQGRELLGHVQQQLETLHQHTEQIRDVSSRPVRIVTLHAIAQLWLQPRLSRYQSAHQDHDFEITATSVITAPPPEADIAINFFAEPPASSEWEPLWEETLIPVSHPDYQIPAQGAVLYQDTHWRDDWQYWEKRASTEKPDMNFSHIRRSSLYVLVLQSVLDGLGVMAARQSLVADYLERGMLLTLARIGAVPVKYGGYYLYQSTACMKNPFARQFCDWLRQHR